MLNNDWGLSTWTLIFLGFLLGPAVAFFVTDSVLTAHNWDEELAGPPVFVAMMGLWLASMAYLNATVTARQVRRFKARPSTRERRDEDR